MHGEVVNILNLNQCVMCNVLHKNYVLQFFFFNGSLKQRLVNLCQCGHRTDINVVRWLKLKNCLQHDYYVKFFIEFYIIRRFEYIRNVFN